MAINQATDALAGGMASLKKPKHENHPGIPKEMLSGLMPGNSGGRVPDEMLTGFTAGNPQAPASRALSSMASGLAPGNPQASSSSSGLLSMATGFMPGSSQAPASGIDALKKMGTGFMPSAVAPDPAGRMAQVNALLSQLGSRPASDPLRRRVAQDVGSSLTGFTDRQIARAREPKYNGGFREQFMFDLLNDPELSGLF